MQMNIYNSLNVGVIVVAGAALGWIGAGLFGALIGVGSGILASLLMLKLSAFQEHEK